MSVRPVDSPARPPELRLWPGVVALAIQWLIRFGLPLITPEASMYAILGGLFGGLVVLIWWAFFSRVPHLERWGAILLMAAAIAATPRLILHKSVATGMMGLMFSLYVIPFMSLALVAWAAATRRLSPQPRRVALVAAILAVCGAFALIRTGGIDGQGNSDFAWRWTQSPEEQLLARAKAEPDVTPPSPPPIASAETPKQQPVAPSAAKPVITSVPQPESVSPSDWPGFRGLHRDGIVNGLTIKTDWATSQPAELWRRPIGPAWSSFAVRGNLVFTQEQRGESEVVSCYQKDTGVPVWTHKDTTRFWESNAGPGPRSTPTLSAGRVYTFGATGILNVLNASDGSRVWTRNVATEVGVKVPEWGFSSSPLVLDDSVIVAAASRLVSYHRATGEQRWVVRTGAMSYSSPHHLTIAGVSQVLLSSNTGITSVEPKDGKVLWTHSWEGFASLQPALTAGGGILMTTGASSGGLGTRRLAVAPGPAGWTVTEGWTSTGLKPYFNDLVVHKGHAYGFDGSILSCIDLQTGTRKWKGGRYGHGQLVLLSEQDLLLVLSEEGEVALVHALPDQFTEVARFKAIEGKTWNHPVISGDVLLVRNAEEMAAFRLSP